MKRKNNIIRVIFVALFVSYYASSTLFFHTHSTGDNIVTHSHPYLPSGSHAHTASSFHLIDSLTHVLALIGVGAIAFFIESFCIFYGKPYTKHVSVLSVTHYQLRAPPAC